MANAGAGWTTSRRNSNSNVSLGLVGVPSTTESIWTADEVVFNFHPGVDSSAGADAAVNSHIDPLCAIPGLPDGQSLSYLQKTQQLALTTDFESANLYQSYLPNGQYLPNTYEAGFNPFPVPQNSTYPDPQAHLSTYETPYFDNGYGAFGPAFDSSGPQALTAMPGNNAFIDCETAQYSFQQYANPNEPWVLRGGVVQTDYVPVDDPSYNNPLMQFAAYPEGLEADEPTTAFKIGPVPSSVAKQDTSEELSASASDSDEDYRDVEVKPTKTRKRATRKPLRKDSLSSDETSAAEPAKYVPGEKPQKVDAKPWIRTNANTEGDTRTAKINHWKNKYEYKPLPLGAWNSGKHTFKYTQYENVDFLTEAPMSTRKINEYITNYPCDDEKRLILWIQKMPADQGRRYGSKQHSKCVFKDCPIQRYVEGTISTGEYRVAFDEKHFTYGDQVDPYDCSAYAHLYCMEQFLDFEQVCQTVDVRVDTRIDMPLEPNGKAAFSMVDVPARYEIEHFVKAASNGKLRQKQRWSNYPYHADYNRDQQKPHEHTLTYLAHCMYEAHQDDSHKKQAALRRVTVSQRRVHLGDLEMCVADKRIMMEVYGGKKKGRNAKIEDHYDERILFSIARAQQQAKDFLELKRQGKKSAKKGTKRKIAEPDETDGEQSVFERARSTGRQKLRAPQHKKQRVNYADSPVATEQLYARASYLQPQPLQPVSTSAQQVQQLQTYVAADPGYSSVPAQAEHTVDPALESAYGLYTVPVTPQFDISDFSSLPTCEDDLPDDNLEKLLALERRQSCMGDFGPTSILKSPTLAHGGRTPQSAVSARFEAQPVTESKEYRVEDPPSSMSSRRSARLAEKDKDGEWQMRKRT